MYSPDNDKILNALTAAIISAIRLQKQVKTASEAEAGSLKDFIAAHTDLNLIIALIKNNLCDIYTEIEMVRNNAETILKEKTKNETQN